MSHLVIGWGITDAFIRRLTTLHQSEVTDTVPFFYCAVLSVDFSSLFHKVEGNPGWTPGLADFLFVCPVQCHPTLPVHQSLPHHFAPVGCTIGKLC